MIIYGWNSKLIKHAPLENVECESCKQNTTHVGIHSSYFHIFWIPVFPFSKKATLVCESCHHVTDEKNMASDFKAKIKALKSTVPLPKYQFSGLAIILALVVYFSIQGFVKEQLESSYLNNPETGDVYVLKDSEEVSSYKYYLFKVNGLGNDSLEISPNSFYYTNIPSELDPKDGFYDYTIKIAKADFLAMQENGELQKIYRDYSSSTGFDRTMELNIEEALSNENDLSYSE